MTSKRYIKKIKISIPFVTLYVKYNVKTKVLLPLCFYEKQVAEVLTRGILASDEKVLCDKISTVLNISVKPIQDFVKYLNKNELLKQNKKDIFYIEKPVVGKLHYVSKEVECNDVFYSSYLKGVDLKSRVVKVLNGVVKENIKEVEPNIVDELRLSDIGKEKICNQIMNYYIDKNEEVVSICLNKINIKKCNKGNIEADVLIEYEYDEGTKKRHIIDVNMEYGTILTKEYIKYLCSQFEIDQ